MQAGKLVDFVRTFLRTDSPQVELPATGHVLDLLNQAMDEASAELGVPAKLLKVESLAAPFFLPADARSSDPIIEVRYAPNVSKTVLLPQVSIERAGIEYPNWEQDTTPDDPKVAIFSTGVDGMPHLYVYPNPGVATYFILYKVKPESMSDLNDEPFNGELDRFHIMLAHYVVFMLNNNNQRFAIYRNFLSDAAGVRQRGPRVTKNAAYRMSGRWSS